MPTVKEGTRKEKLYFLQGVIITDGYTSEKLLRFHLGSKLFLEDVSILLSEFIGLIKPVKEFSQQQGKYKSYQLSLNKAEKELVLSMLPGWHNGTAPVLS